MADNICTWCHKMITGAPIQVDGEMFCSWECSEDQALEMDEDE